VVQQPAVLGHDPHKQVLGESGEQFFQRSAAEQYQLSAGGAQSPQAGLGGLVDVAIDGDGLVLAAGQGQIPHELSCPEVGRWAG
jgi:hypothetical protein